jgi:hypothetical protein
MCNKYQKAILKGSKTIQELEDSNISEIGREPDGDENFGDFDEDIGKQMELLNSSKSKNVRNTNFHE